MSPTTYEAESTADREAVAALLDSVADGLRSGSVRIGDDADALTVDVPEELALEIELETEDDVTSLEFELEWPSDTGVVPVAEMDVPEDSTLPTPDSTAALAGATDGTESMARFELYRDRGDEWRWRLRHRNGNVIATGGEGYTRKHNARKGLDSVIKNSADAAITGVSSDN